jgi:hypothetical protein
MHDWYVPGPGGQIEVPTGTIKNHQTSQTRGRKAAVRFLDAEMGVCPWPMVWL